MSVCVYVHTVRAWVRVCAWLCGCVVNAYVCVSVCMCLCVCVWHIGPVCPCVCTVCVRARVCVCWDGLCSAAMCCAALHNTPPPPPFPGGGGGGGACWRFVTMECDCLSAMLSTGDPPLPPLPLNGVSSAVTWFDRHYPRSIGPLVRPSIQLPSVPPTPPPITSPSPSILSH